MLLNSVNIIGRLTRDPEIRRNPEKRLIAEMNLAVKKPEKPTDRSKDVDFFKVIAYDRAAEYAGERLHAGKAVVIQGRLASRKYTAAGGEVREVMEIVADHISALSEQREPPETGLLRTAS